jgi:hypothetical protein
MSSDRRTVTGKYRTRRIIACLLLAAGTTGLLSGCSDDDDATDARSPTTTTVASAAELTFECAQYLDPQDQVCAAMNAILRRPAGQTEVRTTIDLGDGTSAIDPNQLRFLNAKDLVDDINNPRLNVIIDDAALTRQLAQAKYTEQLDNAFQAATHALAGPWRCVKFRGIPLCVGG